MISYGDWTNTNFKKSDYPTKTPSIDKKKEEFKPFIPAFKSIENPSQLYKHVPDPVTDRVTTSTKEQEVFKREKVPSSRQYESKSSNTYPTLQKAGGLKKTLTKSILHNSKDIVSTHAINPSFRTSEKKEVRPFQTYKREIVSGPTSIDDCNNLVSDCYEKLLDRKIIELQKQMQRLEEKYWGNKV